MCFRDYQSNLDFKPLRDSEVVEDHQISVCVRKRPLNKKGITSLTNFELMNKIIFHVTAIHIVI